MSADGADLGPALGGVEHRRGSFVLDCPAWSTLPGLTAVVGLNGAGKTTLLTLLAGTATPTRGEATGAGTWPLLPQGASLVTRTRVRDLYRYIAGLRGVPRANRDADTRAALAVCGLQDRADTRLSELSGGWRQRVLVGQCLLGDPAGLLLDEPTASLDVAASRGCWQMFTALAERVPVVVATHEASAALEFADHVVVLHDGHVADPRPGAELRSAHAQTGGSPESFLLGLITPAGGSGT